MSQSLALTFYMQVLNFKDGTLIREEVLCGTISYKAVMCIYPLGCSGETGWRWLLMGIVKLTETGNSVDSLLVPGFHEKIKDSQMEVLNTWFFLFSWLQAEYLLSLYPLLCSWSCATVSRTKFPLAFLVPYRWVCMAADKFFSTGVLTSTTYSK